MTNVVHVAAHGFVSNAVSANVNKIIRDAVDGATDAIVGTAIWDAVGTTVRVVDTSEIVWMVTDEFC